MAHAYIEILYCKTVRSHCKYRSETLAARRQGDHCPESRRRKLYVEKQHAITSALVMDQSAQLKKA